MKKKVIVILALCGMMALSACSPQSTPSKSEDAGQSSSSTAESEKTSFQTISADEAKKMMDAGDVTVVDVRTEDEYAAAHIPGAVLVPVESIGETAPASLPDADAVLLVYCRSGNRSKTASEKLAGLGYTKVYDFGGIQDWTYGTEAGAYQNEQ